MLLLIGITAYIYMMLLSVSYFMFRETAFTIDGINYEIVDTAASNGKLSKTLYEYLESSVMKYGRFNIRIKLGKLIKAGLYDTYYNSREIIDRDLEIGDKLTIRIEAADESVFSRLLKSMPAYISSQGSSNISLGIISTKTAIVSAASLKAAVGYEVITSIAATLEGAANAAEPPAIHVITLLNNEGKYYGPSASEYLTTDNLIYGDEPDEAEGSGINRIFDNGVFTTEDEYYQSGELKLIRYIQQ